MYKKNSYVISYDIVCNKNRNRVAEILKDHGIRVQKSVFECRLSGHSLDNLLKKLESIIDKKEDSILIYILCEACLKQNRFIGIEPVREDKDFRVL